MKFSFLVFLFFILGCASKTPQANQVTNELNTYTISRFKKLEKVPFILQKQYHCGPASMAMALKSLGRYISVEQLANIAFTPGADGSFKTDMVSALRRQEIIGISIENLKEILFEIDAENPVIVFQNLGFKWAPLYHYSIIHGYDLNSKQLIVHSGEKKNLRINFDHFERGWMRGGYWGRVVIIPGKRSRSGGEFQYMREAAAFEKLGHIESAKLTYKSVLEKWHNSHLAHFGLGNLAYASGNFKVATRHYQKALELKPDFDSAKHNLKLSTNRKN